jgi:choline dehydrogenase
VDAFDYIVVGAGTAGCVIADRLSESGAHRVLLLEAGGSDRRCWIRLPIGYGRTFNDPRVNWMYHSEPDPGLDGRSGYVPRGRVLGGSGAINAMVYVRGLPQDFDDWRALGNPGWGFEEVRPWFERGEQRLPRTDVSADAHRLTGLWLESCQRAGFGRIADFNEPPGEGVGIYRITTRAGLRASTASCYLHPALRRANLALQLNARVLRLLLDGPRVNGVQLRQYGSGGVTEIRARRGVVLAAGALNTPQLLQLSGIGPAEVLARHGIALAAEHPAVGRHLQDHVAVSYFYRSSIPTLNDELRPWRGRVRIAMRYLLERRGPLAMSVNQGGGFVRSDPAQSRANLQLYFNPMTFTQAPGPRRRLLQPDPFPGCLLSFNACRPSSRGYVEIRSSDPLAAPLIQPNSLATGHDLTEAIAGTRLLRELAATRPLSEVLAAELQPGPATQSDAERLADFRRRAGSVFHPVGTCRMGPDRGNSVVDARLRVHGIEGLRIIDASIFPSVTSANTNAPTLMVAEKGAAMLIEDRDA